MRPSVGLSNTTTNRASRVLCLGLVVVYFGSVACGRASAEIPSASQASSARTTTASPTATIAFAFGPSDCVAPGSGTATEPLGADRVIVNIPPGWTRFQPGPTETKVLVITAPASYQYSPTSITVQSFVGNYYGKTSHDWAAFLIRQWVFADQTVVDCPVGAGTAAFARYSDAGVTGYKAFMVRVDSKNAGYARLWGLTVEGTGGLDANAIADAKKVLGSWRWDG